MVNIYTIKTLLIFLFCCVHYPDLLAQHPASVTVKAGRKIKDVIPTEDLFYYPRFIKGKVFFRDGTKAEALMNYCHLGDQMQFIDGKGDTLALSNERTIHFIQILQDTFYFNKGYLRKIAGNDVVKLASKNLWIVADRRKGGAYNTPGSASSIFSYTSYNEGGKTYDLVINEDLVLKKIGYFYFGDHFNQFVPAGKQNLMMLFPKQQGLIKTYLKENKVEFNNESDLKKLVQHLYQVKP